jgi:hypothetical protein
MVSKIPKAVLKVEIPETRYKVLEGNTPPAIGDILELDQGFTSPEGEAMVLAYHPNVNAEDSYEVEVYESEIETLR